MVIKDNHLHHFPILSFSKLQSVAKGSVEKEKQLKS
jgi:hypothetical protein